MSQKSDKEVIVPTVPNLSQNPADNDKLEVKESSSDISKCKCMNIMFVDDECLNIKVYETTLKSFNFNYYSYNNGKKAYDYFKEKLYSNTCDKCSFFRAIIMDINMPIMDGCESAQNITKCIEEFYKNDYKGDSLNVRKTMIIGCSAYTDHQTKNRAFESGMKAFMCKPMKKVNFIQLLKNYGCIDQDA